MNRSKAPAFHHPSNCVQVFFRSFYIPAFAFLMALFLLQATAVHAQGRIDCASLNIVTVCGTPAQWKQYKAAEARQAQELLLNMQGMRH